MLDPVMNVLLLCRYLVSYYTILFYSILYYALRMKAIVIKHPKMPVCLLLLSWPWQSILDDEEEDPIVGGHHY